MSFQSRLSSAGRSRTIRVCVLAGEAPCGVIAVCGGVVCTEDEARVPCLDPFGDFGGDGAGGDGGAFGAFYRAEVEGEDGEGVEGVAGQDDGVWPFGLPGHPEAAAAVGSRAAAETVSMPVVSPAAFRRRNTGLPCRSGWTRPRSRHSATRASPRPRRSTRYRRSGVQRGSLAGACRRPPGGIERSDSSARKSMASGGVHPSAWTASSIAPAPSSARRWS